MDAVTPIGSARKYVFGSDSPEDHKMWMGVLQDQQAVHEQLAVSRASVKEGFVHRIVNKHWYVPLLSPFFAFECVHGFV